MSVLVFVGVVVSQATGAFFTDTETSSASTFTAGTLELDMNGNGAASAWTLPLGNVVLNPGQETGTETINIGNFGTTNLAWVGHFNTGGNVAMLDNVYIKSAKMEFLNSNGSEWLTADQFITDGTGSATDPGENAYYDALAAAHGGVITLAAWNGDNGMGAGNGVQMGALKPGNKYRFTFTLAMKDDADNSIQGQALSLSYTVDATQINKDAINAFNGSDSRIEANLGTNQFATTPDWFTNQLSTQM